tara:strand:+ start:3866 stop:4093 length:228 start_codon:yes stop_codon:yes gene_type:complete
VQDIKVEVGSHNRAVIDKLFGPLIFCRLRVTAEAKNCEWVIERERTQQDEEGNDVDFWEEVVRIDGQESISFREG